MFLVIDLFDSSEFAPPYNFSFSLFPLSVSFTYPYAPLPSLLQQQLTQTDHSVGLTGERYVSKTIFIGALAIVFMARVIRRLGEIFNRQRIRRDSETRREERRRRRSGGNIDADRQGQNDESDADAGDDHQREDRNEATGDNREALGPQIVVG